MSELPPSLPPDEAYDLVSAVGNHEVKALVLGVMEPDIPYTVTQIHRAFMGLQISDNPAWKVHINTPHGYCRTFAEMGLAAKETVGANGALGYVITERGIKVGKVLAGHLLDLSLQHEPPLTGYFGPAHTRSHRGYRAGRSRIELMRLLRDADRPMPITKVASVLGASPGMAGDTAEDLAVYGIVDYESAGYGKPAVRYMAAAGMEGLEVRRKDSSQIRVDIVSLLKSYFSKHPEGSLSNEDIVKMLGDSYGYAQPLSELMSAVSRITCNIEKKRGALKSCRQVTSKEKARSVVSASAAQLAIISTALDAVDGVRSPTKQYIDGGLGKLEVIMGDPEMVNYLVAKAKTHSPERERTEEERWHTDQLVAVLFETATGPLTVREIRSHLIKNGHNMDRDTLRERMRWLISSGKLDAVTVKTPKIDTYVPSHLPPESYV